MKNVRQILVAFTYDSGATGTVELAFDMTKTHDEALLEVHDAMVDTFRDDEDDDRSSGLLQGPFQ